MLYILFAIALIILLLYVVFLKRKNNINQILPSLDDESRALLREHVVFYTELDDAQKAIFETRMLHFLNTTRITGVNTVVEQLDRILIGASAIIPIFGFADWEYMNLNEVLLYPDSFSHDFAQQGDERTILGIVGDGPYQNIMILSKHELRQGFLNKTGKNNTAIHEFVHLVDKTDGAVDGLPESLMAKQYVLPWLNLMQKKMQEIVSNESDINPYGATKQAEFFAVVSEYFFEQPDLLQEKHPDLYMLLTKIFKQQPQRKETGK
jgi:Mlc titration factor MtfA (ptsG expression regulator)